MGPHMPGVDALFYWRDSRAERGEGNNLVSFHPSVESPIAMGSDLDHARGSEEKSKVTFLGRIKTSARIYFSLGHARLKSEALEEGLLCFLHLRLAACSICWAKRGSPAEAFLCEDVPGPLRRKGRDRNFHAPDSGENP